MLKGDPPPPGDSSHPLPGEDGLRPAVFLDRDGTVIVEGEYISDPEQVRLIPGALGALLRLQEAGFALVLVTNQSGIARGFFTEEEYHQVAWRLETLLSEGGVTLDGTRFCPHHPDLTGPCICRKPAPGMFEEATASLGLDPTHSFFIGDRVRDILPALALGGRGILVRTGYGRGEEEGLLPEFDVVDDLHAAAVRILGED